MCLCEHSETVTVRCEGSQSLFVWRDGTLIRPSASEYIISRATEADSGGYSCCTMSLSVCSDIITLTVSCNIYNIFSSKVFRNIFSFKVSFRAFPAFLEGLYFTKKRSNMHVHIIIIIIIIY
uniref:Ig-like domain-containing protein n=1 Tax=Astatotilapia calliptera TaxID=8154 RepID=A0A3P8P871_ASTCA